jgi:hypothetical protein
MAKKTKNIKDVEVEEVKKKKKAKEIENEVEDLDLDDDGVDDFEVEDFEEEPKESKTEKKTKKEEEIEEKLSETEEIRKMQEDFLSTRENNVIDGDTDILEELLEVDGESVQEVPAPEPKTRKKKTTKKIDYRRTKRKKK